MFEVKDKNNATLFMHDKIRHDRMSDHGDPISTEGIIIVFIDETNVQYQPEGKGLPTICPSNEVVQIDSLAQRAMSLKTDEDFQNLIKDATERYLEAVASGKKTKTPSGRKKAAKPKVEIAQDVLDALAGMKKK